MASFALSENCQFLSLIEERSGEHSMSVEVETEKLANLLMEALDERFSVYCGHAKGTKHRINTSLYIEKSRQFLYLACIDIFITYWRENENGKKMEEPLVLIEFEKTASSPKVILKDVISLLLAKYIHFEDSKGSPYTLKGKEGLFLSVVIEKNICAHLKRKDDLHKALKESGMNDVDRVLFTGAPLDKLAPCTFTKIMKYLSDSGLATSV